MYGWFDHFSWTGSGFLSGSKVIVWSVSQKYILGASSHSLGQGPQYQKDIIRIE